MGKGDDRRPAAVPDEVLADNWSRTFGPSKLERERAARARRRAAQAAHDQPADQSARRAGHGATEPRRPGQPVRGEGRST